MMPEIPAWLSWLSMLLALALPAALTEKEKRKPYTVLLLWVLILPGVNEMESVMNALPIWLSYLFKGLAIFAMMALPAVVVGRAGRNPYMALLLMVPFVNVAVVWAFAYAEWPKVKK
jgi:hypothetical protein